MALRVATPSDVKGGKLKFWRDVFWRSTLECVKSKVNYRDVRA